MGLTPKETANAPDAAAPVRAVRKYLGEVGAVRLEHRFDEARLDAYLGAAIDGYRGPLQVRQFAGGLSNPTYLLETPARKYVLRRKPPGVLLKSAHAVDREYRVMRALASVGFPVPRVLTLCEDDSVIGTMFYVMEHVAGRVFLDCRMPDLSVAERAAVFDSVNATLARLHSLDFRALGLGDLGRPGNYFARQITRWSQQYEQSRTQDIPEMERLMAWLPAAVPADDGAESLTHGDFSFHNVLIHPQEPRVVAVIDWELSTTGHPLGDLMYHGMEWYRPPDVDARGTLRDENLAALGIPDLATYVARYCERSGRNWSGDLAFYRAFNLFRVAAIIQGVVKRMQNASAAADELAEQAARVRPLAAAAWLEAEKAGAA
jgi:aminoglycoside phosphotransferase (APT) family kinase protein